MTEKVMEVRTEDELTERGRKFIKELGDLMSKYDFSELRIRDDEDNVGEEHILFQGYRLNVELKFMSIEGGVRQAYCKIVPKHYAYDELIFNENGRRMINRYEYFPENEES